MSSPFVSEIKIFGGNFAPAGWAFCNGQLVSLSQNTALFSLIGTVYGGDGKSTFGLPNLQGMFPMNFGGGPSLTSRVIGETGGAVTVPVLSNQIPAHTHTAQAATTGSLNTPAGNVWGEAKIGKAGQLVYAASGPNNVAMNVGAILPAGGGQPHNNMPPYLCLTFIIALQGIFPSRN